MGSQSVTQINDILVKLLRNNSVAKYKYCMYTMKGRGLHSNVVCHLFYFYYMRLGLV